MDNKEKKILMDSIISLDREIEEIMNFLLEVPSTQVDKSVLRRLSFCKNCRRKNFEKLNSITV